MRPLIAMIMANLKMTVRNRGAIFWNLLFPAIFIVIFGMVFGGDQSLVINVGVTGDVSAYEQQVTSVFAESDSFELSDSNDRETLLADLEDLRVNGLGNRLGEGGALGVAAIVGQHGEGVVGEAGHQILFTHLFAQTAGDVGQQQVGTADANAVQRAAVAVQFHIQQGLIDLAGNGTADRLFHLAQEMLAIRQTSDQILPLQ